MATDERTCEVCTTGCGTIDVIWVCRNDSIDMLVADIARSRSLSITALLVCSTIFWMGRDWGVLFSRLTADCRREDCIHQFG